jgi:uncharacterized protein Usg
MVKWCMIILRQPVIVTAEIVYYLPDFPHLVQTFLIQKEDLMPGLPELSRFLDFWRREIDAVISTVLVSHKDYT